MSQQEFMPGSQSQQQQFYRASSWNGEQQTNTQSSRWSKQSKGGGNMPKNDHPSTFEDELPPFSYPAQDHISYSQRANPQQNEWQHQARVHESSGNRNREQAYRHYQYQVPWWAQAQRNKMGLPGWLGFLFLAFILLMAVPLLCSVGTFLFAMLFVFSLLPILAALVPIAIFVLIPLIKLLGSDDSQDKWRNKSRYSESWW